MVLSELVTYLAAQGVGTAGTDLFYGTMKEGFPSQVVVLQQYGGMPDEPTMGDVGSFGTATRLEYPRIQIICRGVRDDTDGPFTKAQAVRAALMKIVNMKLSGVFYLAVEPLQPPFRLKTDENMREEYAFNVQVTKALS